MKKIKERDKGWQEGRAKNITFIVTKDCQLACKYCYLVGKNSKEQMSWEVAKAAIDYIFDHEEEMKEESVIWDFIGGEPFSSSGFGWISCSISLVFQIRLRSCLRLVPSMVIPILRCSRFFLIKFCTFSEP